MKKIIIKELVDKEMLDYLRAKLTTDRYEDKNINNSKKSEDVYFLFNSLLDIAEKEHACSKCGTKLNFYVTKR